MTAILQERQHHLRALATGLAAAWTVAGQIDVVTEEELPENRSEAYFVQDEMAKAIGDPLSGWKVGARVQECVSLMAMTMSCTQLKLSRHDLMRI